MSGRAGRVAIERWLLIAGAVAGLMAAGPAAAWEAEPDPSGGFISWAGPIRYSVVDRAPTGGSSVEFLQTVGRAADGWTGQSCGGEFVFSGTPTLGVVSGDEIATVEFLRAPQWAEAGFDVYAAATTDLLYEESLDGTWRIVDADVFVNGSVDWFGDETVDLQAAVTHELGHVLGLRHCCEEAEAGTIPACAEAPECVEAVMYPSHLGISQRLLTADDIAGLCSLYPEVACVSDCASCVTANDCDVGQICVGGACLVAVEPTPCTRVSDCPEGIVCLDGRCVAGEVGDPCGTATDCAAGPCVDGWCATECGSDAECPPSYSCASGVCASESSGFAEDCSRASDCASEVCVEGDRSGRFCSRACNRARPCPAGWSCGEASGSQVCLPQVAAGCRVVVDSRGRKGMPAVVVLLAAILGARRREWRR